ncbi:MAG: hypothetical protein KU37_02195 [Sulfuricurvum sp. PC08-66]|nr:MAG: hypothetical protein KU37_02195 [Sulfuricurvum sp. PC08-66]
MSHKDLKNTSTANIEAHIAMNQELKSQIEALKREILGHEKALARYENRRRMHPLAQLQTLQEELLQLSQSVDTMDAQLVARLADVAKAVCQESFALLNALRAREGTKVQTK